MLKYFLKNLELYLVLTFIGLFLFMAFFANFLLTNQNETAQLAWSFIHGQTYFLNPIDNVDVINFANKSFWPLPPLPAILMMPIVWLAQGPVDLTAITFIFNLLLLTGLFYLSHNRFKFSLTDSLWLCLTYLFASLYISATLTASPYFFAHTLAAILVIFSFAEYYGKKRFWLIGILMGLTFLTRFTAGLAVFFYLFLIIFAESAWKTKCKQLLWLSLPIILAGLLLWGYNYLRFGNPLESGYTLTGFYHNFPEYRPHGFFSPFYIPTNFYFYFLETFKAVYAQVPTGQPFYLLKPPYITFNPWGAGSFFLISPLFILLYKANLKIKEVKFSLLTAGIILLVLLNYFFIGFFPQVGGRYLNDFLPLLFLVLLYIFQKQPFTYWHKILIVFSSCLNLYLYFSLLALYN